MSKLALKIRPANSADKAEVLRFCAETWPGGDYIAEVWDDWAADPGSALLVGLDGATPVALAHVAVAGGEGWFEGLRVAPELRGRGVGRQMVAASLDEVRRRGGQVVRLITNRSNAPMGALLPQLGFRRRFDAQWYGAAALPGPGMGPINRPAAALLAETDAASLLAETGGLYADGWSFVALTPERLARHLAAGEVVAAPAGWAIVASDGESARMAVAFAAGDLAALYTALRAHPAALEQGEIRAFVPAGGAVEAAVRAAGFETRGHPFGVYECELG